MQGGSCISGVEEVAIFEALLPVIPGDPGILEEIWDEMNGRSLDEKKF